MLLKFQTSDLYLPHPFISTGKPLLFSADFLVNGFYLTFYWVVRIFCEVVIYVYEIVLSCVLSCYG